MPPAQRIPSASDASSQELQKVRDRELELKRTRGEISCAECRRLKLKCDKKVPCSSCCRRGCQLICPNGVLSGGQGARLVLADTDKLHRKLADMSKRIRQLEDALQIEYAGRSTFPHPLLTEELLAVKQGIDVVDDHETIDQEEEEDVSGAFGSLSLRDGDQVHYLGASATELGLISEAVENDEEKDGRHNKSLRLSPELNQASEMWPFAPSCLPKHELHRQILAQLPSWERATALCEAYVNNLSWFFRPVDREQLFEELLPAFYRNRRPLAHPPASSPRTTLDSEGDSQGEYDLALLLMTFAVGAAGDCTLPMHNDEASHYHELGRAALGLQSVFDGASLSAVQAVCLLGVYDVYIGSAEALESSWKLMFLAFGLAACIGLHRDPARWNLEPKLVERRRRIFWELYIFDSWKSLSTGRPTTFYPSVVDCEFPIDSDATLDEDGNEVHSIWRWKQGFQKEVLSAVASRLTSTKPLKYSDILELDRKIRDFGLTSPHTMLPPSARSEDESLASQDRPKTVDIWTLGSLLYIHRNFFARAILDPSGDAMRSPFAPSFLAAYRSATMFLKHTREHFEHVPELLLRIYPIWGHALSSSIIVGSVVARGRSISFAPSAFIEFELAIGLFEKAKVHTVARQGLPILYRLREKAQRTLYEVRVGRHVSQQSQFPTIRSEYDPSCKELNILRGTTRYVEKKSKSPAASNSSSSASSPVASSGHSESNKSVPTPAIAPTADGSRSQRPGSSEFATRSFPTPGPAGRIATGSMSSSSSAGAPADPHTHTPLGGKLGLRPQVPSSSAWTTEFPATHIHPPHAPTHTVAAPSNAQQQTWPPVTPPTVIANNWMTEFDLANLLSGDATYIDQATSSLSAPRPEPFTYSGDDSMQGTAFPTQFRNGDARAADAWKTFMESTSFMDTTAFQG